MDEKEAEARPVMGTIFLVKAEKHLHYDFVSVHVCSLHRFRNNL